MEVQCCRIGYICAGCFPGVTPEVLAIIQEAINVVDMYDQANTSGAVHCLGRRAELLHGHVQELRKAINRDKQRTILLE